MAAPVVMLIALGDGAEEDLLLEFDAAGPCNHLHQQLTAALRKRERALADVGAERDAHRWFQLPDANPAEPLDLDAVTCIRLASVWSLTYFDRSVPRREVQTNRPPAVMPKPKAPPKPRKRAG